MSDLPQGRPSLYTKELAREVCSRIAAGESLRQICNKEEMPAPSTVCLWVLDHEEFAEQYRRARGMQAELLADELFSIADDGSNDYMTVKKGDLEVEVPDHENIN